MEWCMLLVIDVAVDVAVDMAVGLAIGLTRQGDPVEVAVDVTGQGAIGVDVAVLFNKLCDSFNFKLACQLSNI